MSIPEPLCYINNKKMKELRNNNFDLLRLFAAFQVMVLHAKGHLKIENEMLNLFSANFLKFFPGVPIFFVISGFLIYSSYERNKNNITQYIVNRCLRIFPALWICFLLTLLVLYLDFEGNLFTYSPGKLFIWSVGQLSFFQFYTPDFLRFWGVGTPNGSLWTITVEIQFYILIPLLYYLFSRFKRLWIPYVGVFLVSVAANLLIYSYKLQAESIVEKLGSVFVLPYLYYFLIGVFFKKYWAIVSPFFIDKFWKWLLAYLLFIGIFQYIFEFNISHYWITSPIKILADILLAGLTLSFSFSFLGLGDKILRGNDISYGLYIYHMLVVNFLVHRGLFGKEIYLLIVIIVTIILSSISWLFVEKEALKSKQAITKAIMSIFSKRQQNI